MSLLQSIKLSTKIRYKNKNKFSTKYLIKIERLK